MGDDETESVARAKEDSFGAGEDFPISCFNDIDSETRPKDFTYITTSIYPHDLTDLAPKEHKKLATRVYLKKTAIKGWGVHAAEEIPAGQFVCEYIGEIITTSESRCRLRHYDASGHGHALFVIREVLPSGTALRTNIDATHLGNVARFFNHRFKGSPLYFHFPHSCYCSCDGGNLLAEVERVSGALIPLVRFYTTRSIAKQEELTFSYGQEHLSHHRTEMHGRACACGSPDCQGALPNTAVG